MFIIEIFFNALTTYLEPKWEADWRCVSWCTKKQNQKPLTQSKKFLFIDMCASTQDKYQVFVGF